MLDESTYTTATEIDNHYSHTSSPARRPYHIKNRRSLNAEFALICNGYHIRIANHDKALRRQAEELVNQLYQSRGLTPPLPPPDAGQPTQFTFASCQKKTVFGTITLGVDTGNGLLADGLYRDEIDSFRRQGRRVAEVTRLAMQPRRDSKDALARIFNLAFITARHVHGATDAFIEVHPRHAQFYARKLGGRLVGAERICPRVNAPAVLMHLSLEKADQRVQRLNREKTMTDRSLYSQFMPLAEQRSVVEQLLAPPTHVMSMQN